MFSMAILAMQADSKFTSQMEAGLKRDDFWMPTLEDSLDLTAKLPVIAAFIYRDKYVDGKFLTPRADLDWSANFGYMIGIDNPQYYDLCRLYFIIHSDHESGNVSAHTMHLIGSALSDVYYAGSAAMNGLAGPLHGRANQEALRWLITVFNQFGKVPTKDDLSQYAWDTLKSGMVIPGYGHAVLRKTDPRFAVQMEFGKKYFPGDDIFKLACLVYETVPDVLRSQGKVKDPWPNVDAISGALQYHYGLADCAAEGGCGFYTVMFGISRMLGITANMVWARAISQPIERPKSLTTAMIEELIKK